MPHYRKVVLASGTEILSVRNPIRNEKRKYIAGLDPIEEWDRRMMEELNIPLQPLSPCAPTTGPGGPNFAARASRPNVYINASQDGLLAAQS
jgi:hypothetical protein